MRTSTAEKSIEPCCRVSTLHLDARRHEIGAALLDHNARQAPRRRPRERESFARGERSRVAGAGQHVVAGPVDDRARQVGAYLRERGDTSRRVAHQNARVIVGRVAEQERASWRNLVGGSDSPRRRGGRATRQADERDQDVDARQQARTEREKLRQFPPRHVVVFVPPDGEVLAPARTFVSHQWASSSAATSYGSTGGGDRLSELKGMTATFTWVTSVGTRTNTLVRTC